MEQTKNKPAEGLELSIEERLRALFELQKVDSKIDEIRILRGGLPLEVQDLEDDIAGLETRIQKINLEIKEIQATIVLRKNEIKDSEGLIKKYESQQMDVRNNREYDAITKEVEYQKLEIELAQKKIREADEKIKEKNKQIEEADSILKERNEDLDHKKQELDSIVKETKKDEEDLINKSKDIANTIEPRLVKAYYRIRNNFRNGLAVVTIQRDACGGCHNKIPPQRQLDIKSRKKVIVCEYCGRVLVDEQILEPLQEGLE